MISVFVNLYVIMCQMTFIKKPFRLLPFGLHSVTYISLFMRKVSKLISKIGEWLCYNGYSVTS